MEESAETRRERLRAMREEAAEQQQLATSQMLLPPPLLSEEHPNDAAAGTPGFNFYTEPMSGFKRKPALLPRGSPRVPFHHHLQQQQQQQQRPQWVAYQQQHEFIAGLHQPASAPAPAPFGFVAPGYPVGQPSPVAPFPGLVLMQPPPADMPFSRGRGDGNPSRGGRGERFNGNSSNRGGRGERFNGNSSNRGGRGERFNGNSSRGRGRGRYSSFRGSDQGGRGRGFHHEQSATQGGHQYFKKWMLDDPWKDLTPKSLP